MCKLSHAAAVSHSFDNTSDLPSHTFRQTHKRTNPYYLLIWSQPVSPVVLGERAHQGENPHIDSTTLPQTCCAQCRGCQSSLHRVFCQPTCASHVLCTRGSLFHLPLKLGGVGDSTVEHRPTPMAATQSPNADFLHPPRNHNQHFHDR